MDRASRERVKGAPAVNRLSDGRASLSLESMPMKSGSSPASRRSPTPTYPAPRPDGLAPVLERNIRQMDLRRERDDAAASLEEQVAQKITDFTGSMVFVYLHRAGC